ncbi:MAG: hydrogenase maturation nickel metallochaperone HypA [Bryobacteraceae bacterium]
MHEASIVQSLIELVRQNVPDPAAVRRVDVRVGLLSGVSPDSMRFYFDLMREEALSPQAELAVTLEPLQARCGSCGAEHSLTETVWLCPACGDRALEFRNGDELHLSSIEVEDGEGIHA